MSPKHNDHSSRPELALVANKEHRTGPTSLLAALLNEFEPFLRLVQKPELHLIDGTYRAAIRYGLLDDYPHLHHLSPGHQGGLVQLANMAIPAMPLVPKPAPSEHEAQNAAGDETVGRPHCPVCDGYNGAKPKLDTVIYLIDPSDPTSMSPGNLALKRECVVNSVTFLSTFTGAREWLTLQWHTSTTAATQEILERYYIPKELLARLSIARLEERHGTSIRDTNSANLPERPDTVLRSVTPNAPLLGGKSVAFIAHNGMKDCIVRLAAEHVELFSEFDHRLGTHSTAQKLNQGIPRPQDSAEWVQPVQHGPSGGDVQIAERVRRGECHKVFFFENPLFPREHENDIQLLERMARATKHDVVCIHEHASAERWAGMWDQIRTEPTETSLVSLVSAYREFFPEVHLILASEQGHHDPWQRIIRRAARVVLGKISQSADIRRGLAERAYIGITWRRTADDIAAEISRFAEELHNGDASRYRDEDDGVAIFDPPLSYRYARHRNLTFVPVIGVRAEYDERTQANATAARFAQIMTPILDSPEAIAIAVPAFSALAARAKGDGPDDGYELATITLREEIEKFWERLDVGVFSCHTVEQSGPKYAEVANEAKAAGAVGEVAGIYLDERGSEITLPSFRRFGISRMQLRKLKLGGGAVLVAGVRYNRIPAALAALRGGLVSVMVTDPQFAREVLEQHAKLPRRV
jgi:methylglyoxal synthase